MVLDRRKVPGLQRRVAHFARLGIAPGAGGARVALGGVSPLPADFNRFAAHRAQRRVRCIFLLSRKIITVCHLDSKCVRNSGINHALVIALAQQGVRQHKDLEILFIN
jgi:hypothetical protein